MTNVSLINRSKNIVLVEAVEDAKSLWSRMRGLLGRESLPAEQALWIRPCDSVHTFFMKFTIDVVFVDDRLVVRKVVRHVRPWRLILPVWKAHSVFELAEGRASQDRVTEGDQLHVGH